MALKSVLTYVNQHNRQYKEVLLCNREGVERSATLRDLYFGQIENKKDNFKLHFQLLNSPLDLAPIVTRHLLQLAYILYLVVQWFVGSEHICLCLVSSSRIGGNRGALFMISAMPSY